LKRSQLGERVVAFCSDPLQLCPKRAYFEIRTRGCGDGSQHLRHRRRRRAGGVLGRGIVSPARCDQAREENGGRSRRQEDP
jgi:hypothetical protein